MNSYNYLEKVLHHVALSTQFMREVTFDVESSYIPSRELDHNHVFITGLARSGTTILLNSLYKSNIFASLTYADMPFVLAPNLWSKIYRQKKILKSKERAHGDGIKFSIESPEAFEEVFWKTYSDKDYESIEKFKIYINNILHKNRRKRYISKNNQNIKRTYLISDLFSDSKILIPFRDPMQHAYSLLTQHKKFIEFSKTDKFISKYMNLIGHTEFGPNYIPINKENLLFGNSLDINHWIEQWYLTYKKSWENLKFQKNVKFICYEKLCNSRDLWLEILDFIDIKKSFDFSFKQSIKNINLNIDKRILDKAFSIYSEISEYNQI